MIIEKETFYRRALLTAFWIRGCWGFFAWELVPFMLKLYPVVSLFFDALLVFIGISVMNRWRDRIFAIAFVAITGYTTCVSNHLSVPFFVNGLRDFISYLFLIPIFNYFLGDEERKKRTVPIFDRHLFVFLIVQAPCLIYQFLVHGACDWGGGSLGNTNSGIITTLIYAISFYLMQKRIDPDNVMKSIFNNKIFIFLLLPTFLNETKVGFIFLLMYFALLIPFNRQVFIRALMAIPIIVMLFVGAAYLNPKDKMSLNGRMEKWILRKAFEDMIPESVAWRQKEQFSHGVGYSWIDSLKALAASQVTDEMMKNAKHRFPVNTPMNKEEYFYRTIFEECFPSQTAAQCVPSVPSVACSTAEALEWDASFKTMNDPSGRAVKGVHNQAY